MKDKVLNFYPYVFLSVTVLRKTKLLRNVAFIEELYAYRILGW